MTPDERHACLAALDAAARAGDAAARAAETLRAVLGVQARPNSETVPLAVACRAWGISKEAGLKRLRREPGLGRKVSGRWRVPVVAIQAR